MTELLARPARRRDLTDLSGLLSAEPRSEDVVLVIGEPPVGVARAVVLQGQAHLEELAVRPEHDTAALRAALVEGLCERLSVHGFGQLTAVSGPEATVDEEWLRGLGFVDVAPDEPPVKWLTGRPPLLRRVLRRHRTAEELAAFLPSYDAAVRADEGTLRLLVRRPGRGQREVLEVGELDVAEGLLGDSWRERGSNRTPDGAAHPDMQLNVMSHPLVEFLAQDPEREPLAGDQMYVDLDLSDDNLPVGSLLAIGDPEAGAEHGAVIEVTEQPHTGCARFIARYGKDAMGFVNGPEGKPRRLRGLCAKVVTAGLVRPGDRVRVTRPS